MPKYKFNVGVLSIEGDDLESDMGRVTGYLAGRIGYLKGWVTGQVQPKKVEEQGAIDIEALRKKLQRVRIPVLPARVKVTGTFFPATLLYSGWWERNRNSSATAPKWRDELQSWLFTGFEQWGPSWNFSTDGDGTGTGYFFGQLGSGDEANSLPVIIPVEKAGPVREMLHQGQQAFDVTVTAFLVHRQHLHSRIGDSALRRKLDRWGKAFDYCLLVSSENPKHAVEPASAPPDMYSGYLWECWMPKAWFVSREVSGVGTIVEAPSLRDIYFVWEHTDFTRPDAVKYNIDSLRHKAKFLAQKHGELVLLQKSCGLIEGDPLLPREVFYNHLFG